MDFRNLFQYREEVIQNKPKKSIYYFRDNSYHEANYPSWDKKTAYHKKQAITYYIFRNVFNSEKNKMEASKNIVRLISSENTNSPEYQKYQTVLEDYIKKRSYYIDNVKLNKVKTMVDLLIPEKHTNNLTNLANIMKNIGNNSELLDYWLTFNSRLPNYNRDNSLNIWHNHHSIKTNINTETNMLALEKLVRIDNPDKWYDLIYKESNQKIEIILETSTPNTFHEELQNISKVNIIQPEDIANLLFILYGKNLVMTNNNGQYRDQYFYYTKHKWNLIDGNLFLSEKLRKDFREKLEDFLDKTLTLKILNLTKIPTFKKNVLDECRVFFFDKNKEMYSKLDNNPNLIGFNNGVFDLITGEFRIGSPSDYLTLSTGINYEKFTWEDPIIKDILDFLQKIIEKPMDFLKKISNFLNGKNQYNPFLFLTGGNRINRHKLIELITLSLGSYVCKLPNRLITLENDFNPLNTEMINTKGRRLAIFQITETDDDIKYNCLNELTNGEKIITRKYYNYPIEFKPQFKIIISCPQAISKQPFFNILDCPQIKEDFNFPEPWKTGFIWILTSYLHQN